MGSRFLYDNQAIAAATSITATSEDVSANPLVWLKNPIPSYVWRSRVGWTIYAGFNDKMDFSDGGDKLITLAPGLYSTGAALAAHIQALLNFWSTLWTVSYSSATKKFTIARSSGGAELHWLNGPNRARSIGKDLGFDVSADDTGSVSYLADSAAYGSRHALWFDLGVAKTIFGAVAYGHVSGTGGTYRVDGDIAVVTGAGSVGSAAAELSLVGDSKTRWNTLTPALFRYWRLLIEDVQNPLAYVELSVPYLGPVLTLQRARAIPFEDSPAGRQLSAIVDADQGAHFVNRKGSGGRWPVRHVMPVADRDGVLALYAAAQIGGSFFWAPASTSEELHYVHTREEPRMPVIPAVPDQWEWQAELLESVG